MSKKKHEAPEQTGVTRRELIGTTAKIATVGGVVAAGVAGVTPADPPRKAHAATEAGSAHVAPGQLDEYYGFLVERPGRRGARLWRPLHA